MKLFTVLAVGGGLSLAGHAAETKVTADQLPHAVQTAMKKYTAGATVFGISKEREHGRLTYEVETKQDGKSRDLIFDERGSLVTVEQEVDLNNLPAPAKQAIQSRVAGGTIRKVESVTQGSVTSYEADVKTKDGKTREIAVNADGSNHSDI